MTDVAKDPDTTKEVKGSVHAFDPAHYDPEDDDGVENTSWAEVCRSCFCHSPAAWAKIFVQLFGVCFFLYFFILGLGILGDGAQVMTGCFSGALFGDDINPISGVMVGLLATVCIQSSSTTTSIIVSLVGAGAITVDASIYMVMGANIGTTVTNTLVAMGQMGDEDQLERAFAGATIHDMFNYLTVAVLLPLEVVSGFLAVMTQAMVKGAVTTDGDTRESFVKKYISPLGKRLLLPNKSLIESIAEGSTCAEYFPTVCEDPSNPTYDTCSVIGLIGCSKAEGASCPSFFQAGASRHDDEIGGLTGFLIGIVMLFITLGGLVWVLQSMLLGASTRVIYKATDINGYLAMLLGALLTVAVQSSSITTSTLTPLVGVGLIRLEQMYPLTLGCNVGTTVTALMAALVTEGTDALQTALSHLFFNVFGIIIWYPIPFMRAVPLHMARQIGRATRIWRGFPVSYIIFVFLLFPLGILGLSTMFSSKVVSQVAIASIIIVVLCLGLAYLIYWLNWKNGRWIIGKYFEKRQARIDTMKTLPYDQVYMQRKIKELQEHTSCEPAAPRAVNPTDDPRAALVTVVEDMDLANTMLKALIEHTGLPEEKEQLGPDGENLGRYVHLVHEPMPDLDTSAWKGQQLMWYGFATVLVALAFWGIGTLLASPVTTNKAMGGTLTVLLVTFMAYRLLSFFLFDGKGKSIKAFKARKYAKSAEEDYAKTMALIDANIDALAKHTNLPALGTNTIAHKEEAAADADEHEDKAVQEDGGDDVEEDA